MTTVTSRWPLLATLLLAGALITGLAACNTTQGVGQDLSAAGKAIEDTAKDAAN